MLWKKSVALNQKEGSKHDNTLCGELPLDNDEFLWAYEIMNFFSIS